MLVRIISTEACRGLQKLCGTTVTSACKPVTTFRGHAYIHTIAMHVGSVASPSSMNPLQIHLRSTTFNVGAAGGVIYFEYIGSFAADRPIRRTYLVTICTTSAYHLWILTFGAPPGSLRRGSEGLSGFNHFELGAWDWHAIMFVYPNCRYRF